MTITHIVWEGKKLGKQELLIFNRLYDLFIGDDDKDFRAYLSSPFFKTNERQIYVYQRIRHITSQGIDHLKGAFVLNKLNKSRKQKLSISYLIDCVNQLSEMILDLTTIQALQTDNPHRWRFLQSTLRNLNFPNHLAKAIDRLNALNRTAPQGFQQLKDDFELAYQHYYAVNTDRERNGIALLEDLNQRLQLLYDTYQEKFALEKLNLKKLARKVAKKHEPLPSTASINLLELYQLNRNLHLTPKAFSHTNYNLFREKFTATQEVLEPLERYILCKYTINALSRAAQSHSDLWSEVFRWTKLRVKWSPIEIMEEGVNDYLNIINLGCLFKEISFVEDYAEEYRRKLPEGDQVLAYNFARAEIMFAKGDFLSAQELLLQKWEEEKDFHLYYLVRYKKLLIKTSIEILSAAAVQQKKISIAEKAYYSASESLRKYLSERNEIGEALIASHQPFLAFSKKVYLLIGHPSKSERIQLAAALEKEISAAPKLTTRKWLLEMCIRLQG